MTKIRNKTNYTLKITGTIKKIDPNSSNPSVCNLVPLDTLDVTDWDIVEIN